MKKSETTKNEPGHPLADELVARGHVPADGRDELAAYLAARERYLGYFGHRSDVQQSLDRLRRSARELGKAAEEARHEAARFREGLKERVLEDLRVILGEDRPDLAEIERAAERLWSVPEASCDPGPVVDMAERQAEAHARLQELLVEVRERLATAGLNTRPKDN